MKVRCIKIFNEFTKEYVKESHWLTIGKEYIVLDMICNPRRGVSYRLVTDDSNVSPAIFQASQFELISEVVPPNWKIFLDKEYNCFCIGPESWQRPGFWDDCDDGSSVALETYKRELSVIYDAEESRT